jgi:hypothetical protein
VANDGAVAALSHQTFALTFVKLGDFVCHAEAEQTA